MRKNIHIDTDSIPKADPDNSMILSVNSKIRVQPKWWLENPAKGIRHIIDMQSMIFDLVGINVAPVEISFFDLKPDFCPVCGWCHDPGYTQIKISSSEVISLAGVLPRIIELVHDSHAKGFPRLSTKDEALLKLCAGYRNPCKAFDDLNHRVEYKKLFDTRQRGFISLRGASGINRNKSEALSE